LRDAVSQYQKTLEIDSENITAHFNLAQLYAELGEKEREAEHRRLHQRFKPDDNAADEAVKRAREKYPAANHAAEAVVIYPLRREGAPGLAGPDQSNTTATRLAESE
jgi:hypothetical protein